MLSILQSQSLLLDLVLHLSINGSAMVHDETVPIFVLVDAFEELDVQRTWSTAVSAELFGMLRMC